MAISNRAAVIAKTQKVLKKHYKVVPGVTKRTILEHLLYACCLENNSYEKADEAFALLEELFYDWNEVRVSSVKELSDTLKALPRPEETSTNIKRALQSVFEAHYSFDLEELRKLGQGKVLKQLQSYKFRNQFATGYTIRFGIEGHLIPIDAAALRLAYAVGMITEKERDKQTIPGLERAISKGKGIEFFSLFHQLAADLYNFPFSPKIRAIVTEIAADAKERLPKRAPKTPPKPAKKATKAKGSEKAADKKSKTAKKTPAKKVATKKVSSKAASPKKGVAKKATVKKSPVKKKTATKKKATAKKAPVKKTATKKGKGSGKPAAKKGAAKKGTKAKRASVGKSSAATKKLARKKPR